MAMVLYKEAQGMTITYLHVMRKTVLILGTLSLHLQLVLYILSAFGFW